MRNELTQNQDHSVQQFGEQDARKLVEDMLLSYGKRFTDQWSGLKKGQVIDKFVQKLSGITFEQFNRGLIRLETSGWPPSVNEFKDWCLGKYEYQSHDEAWLQALTYEKQNRSHEINKFAKQAFDEVVKPYGYLGSTDTFYKVYSSVYKRIISEAIQAFNVAIGFVSDGFKGIQIAANLFVGIIYDLAAAWVQLVSKFTWGDVKQQAIADMDAMATKAQEYYKKASDGALEFKSKGVQALDEIGKTQDQKNAESLAQSKATLDQMLANQKSELNGKKVTEDEKLKAVTAYAEAAIAANKGVMDGMMQADLIAKGYMVTTDQAGKVSVQTFNQATDSVNNTGKALVQARKGAEALGVDLDIALNRVSEKFAANQVHLTNYANGLDELGLKGEQAANALYMGWEKWLASAKSEVEIEAAKAKLQSFGEQGKLSTSQVEMGMQAVKRAVQEIPDSLSPVEAAFERLGIKTKEQLKLAADLALNDFNTILKSGEATQDALQQAYEETIRLAYASGDAQVIAAANAKAAYLGLEVQLDATGKATVTKLGEIQQAAVATQRTVSQVSQATSREQPEISAEQQATNDHWDDFKAKMKARTDELNAKSQGRGSGGGNASLLSNGGDSAQQISAVPDAPLIATSLDIQPMEGMETKQSVEIKIDMGTGQTATVSAAPDQATALEEMMRELEAIKGRS